MPVFAGYKACLHKEGDDGTEYGRATPPERAGGGVKPGAGRGPKILPEPPTESEGLGPRR